MGIGWRAKQSLTVTEGCVMFRLTAAPLENETFHTDGFWKEPEEN